jgi:hypothetical protein
MRHIILRTTLALGVLALAMPALAQDETEHVSRTVKVGADGTLRLRSFSGHVTITGSDRADIAIDAVRRAPRERLKRITLDIRTEGSTVVVEANHRDWSWNDHDNVVPTDFDIKVPRHTNLDVNVFSSPVEVRGVEGAHKIHTFSARIHLEDAVGPINAHTFSGGVDIQAKAWQDHQVIDVDTFSGSIELRIPETARGNVSFNSFSGRLSSDLPLTLHTSRRRSLDATLGGGDSSGGSLHLKTFSGNVHIDR